MSRWIPAALLCGTAVFVSTSMSAGAQGEDPGKHEYDVHCAVCHGPTGRGDGPYVALLNIKEMPDLTTLQRRNAGVYPYERVYDTIDGRRQTKAHGTSDMPIWGDRYMEQAKSGYYEYPDAPYMPPYYVRSRILALTEYLARIQAK